MTHNNCNEDKRTLYVTDLDGTLLNSKSEVSKRTAEILNHLIDDENIMFTIATARTPATAIPKLNDVHLSLPAIVMTGAAMWSKKDNNYHHVSILHADTVAKIHSLCDKHNVNPFIYMRNGNMLDAYHSKAMSEREQLFVNERCNSPFKHFILQDKYNDDDAMLMFAIDDYPKLYNLYEQLCNEITGCEAICYHDIFGEETGLLEIYGEGTSKATAIKKLAKEVNANRIVVFGDNLNDIPMMKIADHAVAMSNAVDEVREYANEIIGTNNDDSVARWIQNDIIAISHK
ncbi:MAG: HAD family hydrolase [Muribaculaceae bacterium]